MNDLISRQAAIDLLLAEGMITAAIYMERVPFAQPEHKKGKWIQINEKLGKCSCCGNIQTTNGSDRTGRARILTAIYKYCPNCGARMEGAE